MREIRFRQRNKNNGQWFYWGLVNGEWVNPKQQDNYDNPEDSDRFTGLPDKNGKDIYEGDIIRFIWDNRKWTQKVIFSNCGFYPAQFDIGLGEFPLINIEVIGNIYEN